MINKCIDCGKEIYKTSTRCKSCARKGKNNPNFGGLTEQHKKNISISHSGENHYMFGKSWTEEQKIKMGLFERKGKNNPNWKGDKVQYRALHTWIKRNKPKLELCEHCKKVPPKDLANISGEYKRDINDFKWLCRKCHMLEDGRIKNLKQFRDGN